MKLIHKRHTITANSQEELDDKMNQWMINWVKEDESHEIANIVSTYDGYQKTRQITTKKYIEKNDVNEMTFEGYFYSVITTVENIDNDHKTRHNLLG